MHTGIEKLLPFLEEPECQKYLSLALQSCFAEFCVDHEIEDTSELADVLGETVFEQLYPCALEFFFSNSYNKQIKTGPVSWNVVDLFLKRQGLLLSGQKKEYLAPLRRSHLDLYEVIGIEPEVGLALRDLIEDRPPVRVLEKSLTRQVG